jgi:hypothetical protein
VSAVEDAVRAYVRTCLGAERVRVERNKDVRAFGLMPRSGRKGWYLAGTVATLRARALDFQAMRSSGLRRRGRPPARIVGQRHNVYLPRDTVVFLRAAGGGSLSRGIKAAAMHLAEHLCA